MCKQPLYAIDIGERTKNNKIKWKILKKNQIIRINLADNENNKNTIDIRVYDEEEKDNKILYDIEYINIPCGNCIDCKIKKSQEWTTRLLNETDKEKYKYFITLTYNDSNLITRHIPDLETGEIATIGVLTKSDYQTFLKNLRKKIGQFRYLISGEYGSKTLRPHYHLLLWGAKIPDLKLFKPGKYLTYTSEIINEKWGKGQVLIGEMTQESCNYVAQYTLKKLFNDNYKKDKLYEKYNIQNEFIEMSTGFGIGKKYYQNHKEEIIKNDIVIANGKSKKTPKYYLKELEKENEKAYNEIKQKRQKYSIDTNKILPNTDINITEYLEIKEEKAKNKISIRTI